MANNRRKEHGINWHARARGAHLRMQTLMYERLTEDAHRLSNRIDSCIPVNPEPGSPDAYLRARYDVDLARILLRRDDPASVEKAQTLMHDVLSAIHFSNREPLIVGNDQYELMKELSGVVGNLLGEHRLAVSSGKTLLERAEGERDQSRIHIALGNLGDRYRAEGYAAACEGDVDRAQKCFSRAYPYLHKRLEARGSKPDLVGRSHLAALRLEELVVGDDPSTFDIESLEEIREEAHAIATDQGSGKGPTPNAILYRYQRLGQVLVELGRAYEAAGESPASYGSRAHAYLQPFHDFYKRDGDVRPEIVIRFADACRLTGNHDRAKRALQSGLNRLIARCGETYGPCQRMRERLKIRV